VEEIGPEIASSIRQFLSNDRNQRVLDRLGGAGLKPEAPRVRSQAARLSGKTFVFTGELERYSRSEAKHRVESLGGRATSSVSGETDYLVVGAEPGGKLDEARKRGVRIIDENEFESLVSSQESTDT
jgi:DNA ligase (NAD+)